MNVVQIITRGHLFYGAQKHVLDMSRSLVDDGHQVTVICGSPGPLTERLTDAGVPFRIVANLRNPMNPWFDLLAIRDIRRELLRLAPDIVATHSAKAGIVGRLAARALKIPSVFTAHGWTFADGVPERQRRIAVALERFCGKFSGRVIAVAEVEREFGLSYQVVPPEKLDTVYYGVEDTAGGPIERSANADPVKLVMVAGFRAQKDHATLLQALARRPELPWALTFLGDGELEEQIRQQVVDLELTDRVQFEGAVDNVDSYLRSSDAMLLITNWEGMPISTIEGLSYGLPVVATDVAGTCEQVIDGTNGYLVPRGDVDAVEEAVVKLIEDGEMRIRFGKEARKLYKKSFAISAMYKKTLSIYATVVSEQEAAKTAR